MKLNSIGVVVSFCLLATSLNAKAGMKDLFDSYQNDLGANHVDVAGGNNWGLGQFSARWNQPTIDVISIESPSISVGCGGIDMYGGSFGLISGDELVQIGRAVAQGAAAYFFKLAINNICSTCAAEMENLQNKLQRLNELARNACSETQNFLANSDFAGEDKLMAQESLIGSGIASLKGTITSWETSIIGDANTGDEKDLVSRQEAVEVNAVYQSVSLLKAGARVPFLQMLSFRGDTENKKIASMLITLLGTKVLKFTEGETAPDAEPSVNLTSPANYSDLIIGKTSIPITIKSCGAETIPPGLDYRCLNIVSETIDYKPLEMVINEKLVGSSANPGIFRKYLSQTPLDIEQKKFVQAFTFPYVRWAVFAKENQINIDDIAKYAATTLMRQVNDEIFNQVSKVYSITAASKLNMYKSGTSFKKEFETSFKGFREQYQMVSKQINENGAQTSQNLDTVVQIAALTKLSKG
ncbi:conjugal transfer protein TraH [Pseudoalteromonas nigrifaciens]|uniref:conjugal transfer protein TraH n=1 Tax=Pseudoalteromonas nigrifaciens TaxID=28109 RepID=UPI003FB7276B